MGKISSLINKLLGIVRLELRLLPSKGRVERSRAPKAVFFLAGNNPSSADERVIALVKEARTSLGQRRYCLAKGQQGAFSSLVKECGFLEGEIDSQGAFWRPGDYALLFLENPAGTAWGVEAAAAIEAYLFAIGSGAIGWVFCLGLPEAMPDQRKSLLSKAVNRSSRVYSYGSQVEDLLLKVLDTKVCFWTGLADGGLEKAVPPVNEEIADRNYRISIVITCKGRLEHLKVTLPTVLSQEDPDFEYVLVDYDCPEGSAKWIKSVEDKRIVTVRVSNRPKFNLSHARNLGARMATGEVLLFLDADTKLNPGFLADLRRKLRARSFLTTTMLLTGETEYGSGDGLLGYGGILAVSWQDWATVRGFDEALSGWGGEDDDFRDRLIALGLTPQVFDVSLCEALDHDDDSRTAFYDEKVKRESASVNIVQAHQQGRVLSRSFGTSDSNSPVEVLYRRGLEGS